MYPALADVAARRDALQTLASRPGLAAALLGDVHRDVGHGADCRANGASDVREERHVDLLMWALHEVGAARVSLALRSFPASRSVAILYANDEWHSLVAVASWTFELKMTQALFDSRGVRQLGALLRLAHRLRTTLIRRPPNTAVRQRRAAVRSCCGRP